jgi:hypothetical protein
MAVLARFKQAATNSSRSMNDEEEEAGGGNRTRVISLEGWG